ncbi:MAG: hypothetical protein ACK4UJ_06860 [Leptonema sp. (in: bacteria)]
MKNFFLFSLFIFFSGSCLNITNLSKEIESHFKKGDFDQALQLIQKVENSLTDFHKSHELILWKARIFSLYPETFGISTQLYKEYLLKNQNSDIYYELFLLYLDLKKEKELKELISADTLPTELIFDQKIILLRNFLECYLKSISSYDLREILNFSFKVSDAYLSNYCRLTKLSLFLKENLKDWNSIKLNLYKRDVFTIQVNSFKNIFTNKQKHNQIINLLELYFNQLQLSINSSNINSKKILCELQPRFPEFEITEFTIENCKKEIKNSILVQRELLDKVSNNYKDKIKPLFDESLFLLQK